MVELASVRYLPTRILLASLVISGLCSPTAACGGNPAVSATNGNSPTTFARSSEGTSTAETESCTQHRFERLGDRVSDVDGFDSDTLQSAAESIPGVRALILASDKRFKLIVSDDYAAARLPGVLARADLDVVLSCVPQKLLQVARETVSALARADSAAFSSVGYDPFADRIVVLSNFSPDVVRIAIENAYNASMDRGLIEIGTMVGGGTT
jgi:hypothetical protein